MAFRQRFITDSTDGRTNDSGLILLRLWQLQMPWPKVRLSIAPISLNSLKGARYLLADKGYDANSLQKLLRQSAIVHVIPGRTNRKRPIRYDERRYKDHHLVANAFCRLTDFRRVATLQHKA